MIQTIVCAMACLVLVYAELAKAKQLRIGAKVTASAAFVTLGLANLPHAGPFVGYARWIAVGLVLGAVGDAALLGKSTKSFLAGLGAFLLGHIAYIVAIACLIAPWKWPVGAGELGAAPVLAGGVALALLWPHLGGMKKPVTIYVLAIVAMVLGAMAACATGALPAPQRSRLLAGAVLFFVSDLSVAREKFVASSFWNKLWGLPAYFAGQLLIAWSLAGLA